MDVDDLLDEAAAYLLGSGDPDQLAEVLQDVLRLLARTVPVFGAIDITIPTAATVPLTVLGLPDGVVHLLSVHSYPKELEPVHAGESMDLLTPGWRARTGTPTRYTQEVTFPTQVRLIPAASTPGTEGIPPFSGIPGSADPTNALVTMILTTPEAERLPEWWGGLLALGVAAQEARRDGHRQNLAGADALSGVAGVVLRLLLTLYEEADDMILDAPWRGTLMEGLF